MIAIKVSVDATKFENLFYALRQDQIPYATAVALTRTAGTVKTELRAEMQRVFTSAVPYTLNSLYVKSATKQTLVAVVGIKTQGRPSAADWLSPEIQGGFRYKGIETFLRPAGLPPSGMYALPGSACPMSSGGKVNVRALQRIVQQLQALPQGAGPSTLRKMRTGRRKSDYFYLTTRQFGLPPGIFGIKGRQILPIIIFTRQPTYRAKFDFYGIAQRVAERDFPGQFDISFKDAVRTARL